MKLALVTGGNGFIGSHVVAALRTDGVAVRVLDLVACEGRPDIDQIVGDVRSRADCDAALDGVDVVLHQAAKVGLGVDVQDLPDYADINVTGTATLLAAMATSGPHRLVLASSMVVYGEGAYRCPVHGPVAVPPRRTADLDRGRFEPSCPVCGAVVAAELVTEDAPLDPRNAYAASKVAQEHLAASWARNVGGRVAALRYHNVYGPGLPLDTPYAGVAALFCARLARGEPPLVFEDGQQRRDFVHVRDVAAANVAALRAQASAGALRAYNVGSGHPRTVHDMAQALAEALRGPTPLVTGEYRLGDVRHITASSRRAGDELGWTAATSFDDGMRELATDLTPPC